MPTYFDPTPTGNLLPGVKLHAISGPFENIRSEDRTGAGAARGRNRCWDSGSERPRTSRIFLQVPEASKELLQGLDDFILDALRYRPHPMHSNVEQSLALVAELKPKRAWFTHICHDLGHAETNQRLPEGVQLAYDGLKFEVEI